MSLFRKERSGFSESNVELSVSNLESDEEQPWDFYSDIETLNNVTHRTHLEFEVLDPAKRLSTKYLDPLPAYSAVVGVCLDGLPLLLDLQDPTPGSILMIGDESGSREKIMTGILTSICLINRVDQAQVEVISPQPNRFAQLHYFENFRKNLSSYERKAAESIIHATALAEQRKSGRHLGPSMVIAIEDVSELIKHDDFEIMNHLVWLIRHGPKNGVWLVASLDPNKVRDRDKHLITSFKTHIFSEDRSRQLPIQHKQSISPSIDAEYFTSIGGKRVGFWVPVWESA